MATTVYTNNQHYSDIAAAIRNKNGTNTTYKPSEMAAAINALIVSGGSINLQAKTVSPTTSQQVVTYDNAYNGLSQVTVNAIQTETKSATPSTSAQTITPASGKYLTSVSIAAIQTETKSATPSTSTQNITPSSGKYLTKVTVNPIPSNYIVPTGNYSIVANGTGINIAQYATVDVNVPTSSGITPTGNLPITINGTYNVTDYATATVNVPIEDGWIVITSENLHDSSEDVPNTYINGSTETAYNGWTSTGYIPVEPNSYYLIKKGPGNGYNAFYNQNKQSEKNSVAIPGGTNDGYVLIKTTNNTYYLRMSATSSSVSNFEVYKAANKVPSGSLSITTNGIKDVSQYETVNVNVPTGATVNNQDKTVSPTTSQQTVTADSGYTGLGTVTVNAIETETETIVANGTYTPAPGKYYSNIVVGVSKLIVSQDADGYIIFTQSTPPSHNLPSGYQEVVYIDGNATGAVINTGIQPDNTTYAKLKVQPLAVTGDVLFGTKGGNDNSDWRFFNYSNKIYWDCYSGRIFNTSISLNQIRELEFRNNYIKDLATGNVIDTGTTIGSFTIPYDIYINGANTSLTGKACWYYVQIFKNDAKVRDFIPCYRKSDNECGMYDLVTDTFFESVGAGDFTAGPIIS